MKTDTIAAIATAMSDSGIGIIRVSGDDAIQIVNKIYRTKSGRKKLCDAASHTIHYGYIVDNIYNDAEDKNADNSMIIDEVMVSVMKSPNSYTTEDTVEINCHGGVFMVNRILEEVIKNGARIAEPGEFTKRAFLNGRIDLSKAEAVIDIIHAKNQFALKSSVNQLKGSISSIVNDLREQLIYEIAFIESALDDPEHISLEGYGEQLEEKINIVILKLKELLDSSDNGKILKEGINTVIVGKPNAGKSSLLNILVGEEKAIVTNIAGTTRDVLEETIKFQGITLNVIDTAGIRYTEDVVEKIGVERAKKYAFDADLIIYVVDASVSLDESDHEIIRMITDKKVIILLNKTDLEEIVSEELLLNEIRNIHKRYKIDNDLKNEEEYIINDETDENIVEDNDISKDIDKYIDEYNNIDKNIYIIKTSTKENKGIDLLEQIIKDMFINGKLSFNDEVFITNMRHKEAILHAYESMLQVKRSLDNNMPEDFYSIDLMSAYASLGTIIGEEVGEDLVNEIFSKFCMGK